MAWTIRFIVAPSGGEVPRFPQGTTIRCTFIFATVKYLCDSQTSWLTIQFERVRPRGQPCRRQLQANPELWHDGGENHSNGRSIIANSMTPPHFQIQSPEFKPCQSRNALSRLPFFPTASSVNPTTIDARYFGWEPLPHLASRFLNGFRTGRAMQLRWNRSRLEPIVVSSCFSMAGRVIWICGT